MDVVFCCGVTLALSWVFLRGVSSRFPREVGYVVTTVPEQLLELAHRLHLLLDSRGRGFDVHLEWLLGTPLPLQ